MSTVTGRLWQIQWNNPYTQPPDGWPRILAQMFVPHTDGNRCPAAIDQFPRPRGYSIYITHIAPPIRRQPTEKLIVSRRNRRAAKNARTAPLFADQFTAQDIAANPDYFAGHSDHDARRDAILDAEAAAYAEHIRNANQLIVYHNPESTMSVAVSAITTTRRSSHDN